MNTALLIAIVAGLASGLLFVAGVLQPVAAVFLIYFTPLPLFIAGLGWGYAAAAIAVIVAGLVCVAVWNGLAAFGFVLSLGLPVVALCYLVMLNRETEDGDVNWYPSGHLVAAVAVFGGLAAAFTSFAIGMDTDTYQSNLSKVFDGIFKRMEQVPNGRVLKDEERAALMGQVQALLPVFSAISTMGLLMLNLFIGGKISASSQRLDRPWPDLGNITLPSWVAIAFMVVLAGAILFDGYPAILMKGFAGAFMTAYAVMGLSILHYVTRGINGRAFALFGFYLALLITPIGVPLLVILALAEPMVRLRSRFGHGLPPPSPPGAAPPPT